MRSLRLLSAVFFVIEVSLPTAAEGFDCGKGENIYGSVEDGKFNLRCEPPENATHFKAIKCPPGTVFDAA
ncbi:MAG TPA: hypothetical protein VFV50_12895, partial [Bdellovibrionales bacterium]|nr:hypothetical protein [Bdellovibrionales bacterium]